MLQHVAACCSAACLSTLYFIRPVFCTQSSDLKELKVGFWTHRTLCVCVRVYACVIVCMCVCVCVRVWVYVCMCLCVCLYLYVYVCARACACVIVCMCVYVCDYACACEYRGRGQAGLIVVWMETLGMATIFQVSMSSNTLQWTAKHTVTHCDAIQQTATYGNTWQHTAAHGSTQQHTITQCNVN